MADNGSMVWQPDILGLVIGGTPAIATAWRITALVDDKCALDVYFHGTRVYESGVYLCGAGGGPGSTGDCWDDSVVRLGVGGQRIGGPIRRSSARYILYRVRPRRHCRHD